MEIQRRPLMISRLVMVDKCDAHIEPIAAHCFSCQPWDLRGSLSSGPKLLPYLHFEALQALLGICFKTMSFLTTWRRKWQSTPVLLPGKYHGQRSLVGYSPWGREESDMTEQLHFHFHFITYLLWSMTFFTNFLDPTASLMDKPQALWVCRQ